MTRTLLLASCLAGLAAPVSASPDPAMRAQTETIARRYLEVWSSNDAASVEGVPYVYGSRVLFYGKPYSQAQLQAEKRRALRRWPVRRYVHRPGSLEVICNERSLKCAARSIIDYEVANPARGTRARGAATFDLGLSFAGPKPVILYETGGPLRSRRSAGR